MLEKFSVSNYRTFSKPITLDLKTTHDYKFNQGFVKNGIVNTGIVFGRNATGKTNLGRAISDIGDNIRLAGDTSDQSSDANRGSYTNADTDLECASFSYSFDFEGTKVQYEYDKDRQGKLHSELLTIDGELVFSRKGATTDSIEKGNLALIDADQLNWEFESERASVLGYLMNAVPLKQRNILMSIKRFTRGSSDRNISSISKFNIVGFQNFIVEKNLVERFEKFLLKFGIEEHLIARESPDGTNMLYCDHRRPIRFDEACSSGTETISRLFLLVDRFREASFYFFDEFDANCHFELAEEIVSFLESDGRQAILTTHNTSLLSNSIMRPDCYFVISRNGWIKPLPDLTERELREGHNLEKLYRAGEFIA